MQDIKQIKENLEQYKKVAQQKNIDFDFDKLLSLSEKKNNLTATIEDLRRERNSNVEDIKKVSGKPPADLIEKGKLLKDDVAKFEKEFQEIDAEFKQIMWTVPNLISPETPIGKDESENLERRRWSPEGGDGGSPKAFNFKFKDHIELGESLNILDLDRGVKTSGFRGYYLKNEASLMHMGLMMYGMKLMQSKGFQVMVPPTIVKPDALWGSGHFPFDEKNIYVVDSMRHSEEDDAVEGREQKFLVGTAEPSLLNYHRDETLTEDQLPVKLAGYSPCYRSEIGGYGRDTKGMYRIHEFMKIEQVVLCKPEDSAEMHTRILGYSEELLRALELPYRILEICTGDMGCGKYRMYDIETWMPSRNAYGETHSASNLTDWQPRRLNIKVVDKDGNKYFPHALNNTVVASPRIMIAIWENYQNEDGTITVPKILREYVGKDLIGK